MLLLLLSIFLFVVFIIDNDFARFLVWAPFVGDLKSYFPYRTGDAYSTRQEWRGWNSVCSSDPTSANGCSAPSSNTRDA
jgi:hypothetical protein